MPDKAPVDAVGRTQKEGPWPDDVTEIVEGKAYKRPVTLSDGSTQELTVDVTGVNDILADDGTPTGSYAVTYQFDNPTIGGG